MQTETLEVQGMSCEACVGHVTRALTALGGVQSAIVSLETHSAVVTYDPFAVQVPQMVEAVIEEGYAAAARI